MKAMSLCLLLPLALAQRRVFQGRPAPGQRIPGRGGGDDQDLRLGLLAEELGLPPVPGANNHLFGGPSGSLVQGPGGRDQGCWCQPVNQPCTDLRPENLDLVTRIANRPGSPDSGGAGSRGCPPDRRLCCPGNVPAVLNPTHGNLGSGGNRPGFVGNPAPTFNNGGFSTGPLTHGGSIVSTGASCGVRAPIRAPPAVSPTADQGEYPWMAVVLGPGDSYVAGGVLVAPRWVLTTPHKLGGKRNLQVRLGDYDVSSAHDTPSFPHYQVAVKRVVTHPRYDPKTLANDVALLELDSSIPLDRYPHVTPACLPRAGQTFTGQRCFVSGWGKDAFSRGQFQRKLQEVDVPVVAPGRCERMLRNTRLGAGFNLDHRSFICAGGEKDKDACQGDGGSPLVCHNDGRWTVGGLVAWGVGCAQENVPGVYVNVASYTDFINHYV